MDRESTRRLDKPADVFDREAEWADLATFVASPLPGLRIAVVYGRRRQGKSYLLRRLADAVGGLYHLATEQAEQVSLRRFGDSLAAWAGLPAGSFGFGDWERALRTTTEVLTTHDRPGPPAAAPHLVRVGDLGHGRPAVRDQGAARPGRAGPARPAVRLPGCAGVLADRNPGGGLRAQRHRRRHARLPGTRARPMDSRRSRTARGLAGAERAAPVHAAFRRGPTC